MSEPGPIAWKREKDAIVFTIHVSPRARHDQVGGVHDGALRVSVTAAPADGAANAACVQALSRALGVRPTDVELDPHSKHRRKRVRISGSPDAVGATLGTLAASPSRF